MTQRAPAVFLPGILMPANARYAPLLAQLGDDRLTLTKELEVYAASTPPRDYSMRTEIDGLDRFADDHRLGRFHLYGHSAGASIALAYVSEHPARVASVALDEPASDFSDEDRAAIAVDLPVDLDDLPVPERMARFVRNLVRADVELPEMPPPSGDPEMAKRPAGLGAFSRAMADHTINRAALRAFDGPVYFSYGSLSNERWADMAERFERDVPRCTTERYDGVHHLYTSHQAQPERVASVLTRLWADADTTTAVTP
jgi:pimeloyl-ACP methyl ester carboxylesterase